MLSSLRRAAIGYGKISEKRPIAAATLSTGVIFGLGDVLVQLPSGQVEKERTGRMALFSSTVQPLYLHHWFGFLERWRPSPPSSAPAAQVLRAAGAKVVVDQAASACVIHAIFLTMTSALQGRSYDEVQRKLRRDWFTLVKASWYAPTRLVVVTTDRLNGVVARRWQVLLVRRPAGELRARPPALARAVPQRSDHGLGHVPLQVDGQRGGRADDADRRWRQRARMQRRAARRGCGGGRGHVGGVGGRGAGRAAQPRQGGVGRDRWRVLRLRGVERGGGRRRWDVTSESDCSE